MKKVFTNLRFVLPVFIAFVVVANISCKKKQLIALQPFGQVSPEVIEAVKTEIENFYGFEVVVLEEREISADTYYAKGDRYNSSVIIRRMKKEYPDKYDKILAITEYDIYHTKGKSKYKGIVGLGLIGGRTAIVSTCRLTLHDVPSERKKLERVSKSAIHELGHTYGLKHCTESTFCIMKSSNGYVRNIDKKEKRFCESCLNKIDTRRLKIH